MTTTYVTYPGDAGTRFDRDDHLRHHVPLVMERWGPLGLRSCAAFWPADANDGTVALAACRFRDEAAMRTALASAPNTARHGRRRLLDRRPTHAERSEPG